VWTSATGTVVSRYGMDGWSTGKPAANAPGNQNWDVWAVMDVNNSLVTRYINGDGVNQVFARVDANGVAWLLTDALGSVRDVVSNSGRVLSHIDYGAFGNITYQSNPALSGDLFFTGDQFDPETGFYFSRARYYDPTTARWTTQDPMSFAAGQSNLYQYVSNSPTSATDPSGLWSSWRYFLAAATATLVVAAVIATGGLALGPIALGVTFVAINAVGVAAGTYAQSDSDAVGYGIVGGLLISGGIVFSPVGVTYTTTTASTAWILQQSAANQRVIAATQSIVGNYPNTWVGQQSALGQGLLNALGNPSNQVSPLGNIGGSQVMGSITSGLGICQINGVTMWVQQTGSTSFEILGRFYATASAR